jgi:hypothetical protein
MSDKWVPIEFHPTSWRCWNHGRAAPNRASAGVSSATVGSSPRATSYLERIRMTAFKDVPSRQHTTPPLQEIATQKTEAETASKRRAEDPPTEE